MKPFLPVLPVLGKVYNFSMDAFDSLFRLRDELIPPRRMRFVGNGNYIKDGNEFLEYFQKLGSLKPDDSVLDVGCGIGRKAAPLTRYLSPSARYEGFDIVEKGIDWATKNITAKFPNFHFTHISLYNKLYADDSTAAAEKFRFPYEDGSFDFVFLTSVFTHMLPADVENYMSEISRVLKKGGRCLITYFLINDESLSCLDAGEREFSFKYKFDKYRVETKEVPEDAIAYDETYIKELYQKNNLQIQEPVHYGSWCGRKNYLSGHDIIVAQKI